MGICCSNHDPTSDDALAFTGEENPMISDKKNNYSSISDARNLQDKAPLLNTTDMKMVAATDSSDASFNEDEINKMLAEAEETSDE
ncbi:hypothetical protein M9Y10_034301 [Tritrichomonas musculus]|uniref:Uncharacterized protein n=1 Tax=Tritrichomonas musculus TaxID=1915356 RepID=A0ABR2KFI6_9EUKA